MDNELSKYIFGEMTSEERIRFSLEIKKDENMKKEFFKLQNMMAMVDWVLVEDKDNLAQQKLSEFMDKLNNK